MKRNAVYPGTFDPITNGHTDLVRRAASIFNRVVVAIAANPNKAPMFSLEQRVDLARRVLSDLPNVEVMGYSGLTVEFCKKVRANFIIRGIRTSADFEFERSIGQVNKTLGPGIETIFLLSDPEYASLNSSIVREIISYNGDISSFVPAAVKVK